MKKVFSRSDFLLKAPFGHLENVKVQGGNLLRQSIEFCKVEEALAEIFLKVAASFGFLKVPVVFLRSESLREAFS